MFIKYEIDLCHFKRTRTRILPTQIQCYGIQI